MPDLTITYTELLQEVGRFVGWGYFYADWSADATKVDAAKRIVRSGLRRFYYALSVAEGEQSLHRWSFLTPVATLALPLGEDAVLLPENFVSMREDFIVEGAAQAARMVRKPESSLRDLYRTRPKSGKPEYYALRPVPSDGTGRPRYEAVFYPLADENLTLSYRYMLSPPELSDDAPYHLGGAQHSETVLEACLAAAENYIQDEEHIHEGRYIRLLASSIEIDRDLAADVGDGEDVWEDLGESETLEVNRAYLRRVIGRFFGYGPHSGLWSRQQAEEVNLALESGLRSFYNPPVIPGESYPHEWSFLRPLSQVQLEPTKYDYDLPDDFSMFFGPLTFQPGEEVLFRPIDIRGEEYVRQRRQYYLTTGRPTVAAVVPKRPGPDGTTRYYLSVWPTPDAPYVLLYRYQINPMDLSDDSALPIGGQAHAQTVLQACLMAADEMRPESRGVQRARFMECLKSSVGHDRMVHAPDALGCPVVTESYIRDWHDMNESMIVTYNGQSPE